MRQLHYFGGLRMPCDKIGLELQLQVGLGRITVRPRDLSLRPGSQWDIAGSSWCPGLVFGVCVLKMHAWFGGDPGS